jgi:hypothetical protein
MESVIEVQRQTHEEIERFERALADILSQTNTTVRYPRYSFLRQGLYIFLDA